MAIRGTWRTLSEMDLHFARSRRRAAARRLKPPQGSKHNWRAIRIAIVVLALFAFVGESTRLEISNARSAAPKRPIHVDASCGIPLALHRAFHLASVRTGLPLALLTAIASEESRMDPHARSAAGARGLFQLMPGTAKVFASDDSPETNVLAGARYFRQILGRFHGDLELALAAYNAGPTAVEQLGRAPSLETVAYVKNVENRLAGLSACR